MCTLHHSIRQNIKEDTYTCTSAQLDSIYGLKILPKFNLNELSDIDQIKLYTKSAIETFSVGSVGIFASDFITSDIFTSDIISSDIFTSDIFTSDIFTSDIYIITSDILTWHLTG